MANPLKLLELGTKIVAVGLNCAAHAKELGNAVPRGEPLLFLKPTSSYLTNGCPIQIPHPLESLDHEVELAVVIGQKARDVEEYTTMDYVGGYTLALDVIAREIQASAKLPKSMIKDPDNLELLLKVLHRVLVLGAGPKLTAGISGLIDVHFAVQKRQRASNH